MAKKSTKKAAGARSTARKQIELRPTARQLKTAEQCLERSGKIKIGFKEISVTKLPKTIAPVAVFMD